MRRVVLPVTALVSVLVLAYALHARVWWAIEESPLELHIGVRSMRSCFADNECKTYSFASLAHNATRRERPFLVLGRLTYVIGLGTLGALAVSALLASIESARRRPLGLLVCIGCGVTVAAATAFVLTRPGDGEMNLHMGVGFPLLLAGCGLGTWHAILTMQRGGALPLVAPLEPFPAPARPAPAAPAASSAGVEPTGPAELAPPAPPPGSASRPPDMRVRAQTFDSRPVNPLALGPPCPRCAAPTRWAPSQRWECDRCPPTR